MNTKELMKPRWKVIANFPGNEWFEIGDIIINNSGPGYKSTEEENWIALMPNSYPAIFKKLKWWEERSEEDLPKFLKSIFDNKIYPVSSYSPHDRVCLIGKFAYNANLFYLLNFIPSTREEYEKQQNSISKTN